MKPLTFLYNRKTPVTPLVFPNGSTNGAVTLRENQLDYFRFMAQRPDSLNRMLAACPSWGKGVVGRAELLQFHKDGKFKRFVWLSPTRQMAGEATQIKTINLPDGSGPRVWKSSHPTHEIAYSGVIEYIRKWFSYDRAWDVFADCVLITTRSAFVMFMRQYPELVKDTFIALDEAQYAQVDDEQEKDGNCIGDCLNHILETQYVTRNGIGMHSGTMIRGNMFPVVHEKYINAFPRFDVPLSKYMEGCKSLKSIGWTTHTYKTSPEEIIWKELETMQPFIGWIGRVNSAVCRTKDLKWRNVMWFINAIAQSKTPKFERVNAQYNGKLYPLLRVWRGTKDYLILNVVNEYDRDLMYEYLRYAHEGKVRLDGVISLELLKVGTNFGYARKAIYIGYIPHSGEGVQCLCRLVRDLDGKEHVSFTNIIPHVSTTSEDTYLDRLNQHLQATVMTAEALPYVFRTPDLPKRLVRRSRSTDGNHEDTLLQQYARDIDQACEIKNELIVEMLKCAGTVSDYENVFRKRAETILEDHGVQGPIEEIVEEFLEDHLTNDSLFPEREQLKALHDIPEGLMDLVTKYHKFADYLTFETSGVLTEKLMRDVANAAKDILRRSLEEAIQTANKLAKNGILPTNKWLVLNGYAWVAHAIYNYPKAFEHLQQEDARGISKEECVKVAETLAKNSGGVLKSHSWLKHNGYGNISATIHRNPELFDHIQQESELRTLEEAVSEIEMLAKQNGGKIPHKRALHLIGKSALIHWMLKNPKAFKHLKQENGHNKRMSKHDQQCVETAERICAENAGVLPPSSVMKRKHLNVYRRMCRKPELFSHLKQQRLLKSQDEWVEVAKKLSKQHGSKWRNHTWLAENGYKGLSHSLYKYPELYSTLA